MTVQRIADRFARCASENRAAFVGYLMAGDPSGEISFEALKALAEHADIVEIGAPFTDPMADGPSIQRAALRSLAAGTSLAKALELAARLRAVDKDLPIILMGYANPVHHMGYARFAAEAAQAGIDGVITVDLPPEEDGELRGELEKHALAVIRLATPTTGADRMRRIADGASGFIYYVSVTGVTGAGSAAATDVAAAVERAKRISGLPVVVGFGVRTPEQAAEFARISDGVVVGSALVDKVRAAVEESSPETCVKSISVVAKTLSNAIASARA
ncbi:MAG: tryptophan synthase subunit alpha [Hyphomonadaceae bacterium]